MCDNKWVSTATNASSGDCIGFVSTEWYRTICIVYTHTHHTRTHAKRSDMCHPSEGSRSSSKKYLEWNKIWRPRYILAVLYYTRFRVYSAVHWLYTRILVSARRDSMKQPQSRRGRRRRRRGWTSEKKICFKRFRFPIFLLLFRYCHSIVRTSTSNSSEYASNEKERETNWVKWKSLNDWEK